MAAKLVRLFQTYWTDNSSVTFETKLMGLFLIGFIGAILLIVVLVCITSSTTGPRQGVAARLHQD